jgi:hypothetical protein
MEELFNIANEEFYIDIDRISDYIKIDNNVDFLLSKKEESEIDDESTEGIIQDHQMIDVAKWEVIKALIESILNENSVLDESMGIKKLEGQLSIPFRLSFNTLLKNKIIRKNG